MTPPTTDTSRKALRFIEGTLQRFHGFPDTDEVPGITLWHLRTLLTERDAALFREKSLKDNTEELRQLRREFNAVKAERDALRDQLAAARNERLEEAARVVDIEYEMHKDYRNASLLCNNDEDAQCRLISMTTCASISAAIDALKDTTPAPLDGDMASQAMPITFTYKNYRGEVAKRTVIPKAIWFGTTEWHPEPGWLMTAYDLAKAADRDFALADCSFAPREVTVQEDGK